MFFTHHTESCFESALGERGISRAWLEKTVSSLAPALKELQTGSNKAAAPLLALAAKTNDIDSIHSLASHIKNSFGHVVVVGAGGSSLGSQVFGAFAHRHVSPGLHFLDNIDPDAIARVFARIEIKTTCFIVISKSGSTAETLAHFYVLLEAAKKALDAKRLCEHFVIITTAGKNPLRDTAEKLGIRVLDHPADIGGRFSLLTVVGLLPGAIAGVDIRAIRSGAQSVVESLQNSSSPLGCESALGALLQYGFAGKGRNISVMLPYSERLSGFSSWYRQSWAESLGKDGKGTTPIRAVGTTDQHSQLQLYLDGPKDKLFHLITLKRAGTGQKIVVTEPGEFIYLDSRTSGDVMQAQQQATLETLIQNGCPVRHFELEILDEAALGALVMHFTLEIIFMSYLLGINPFDQPAVEESKRLSRQYMGAA